MLKYNFYFDEDQPIVHTEKNEFAKFYSPCLALVEKALDIDFTSPQALSLITAIYSEAKPIVNQINALEKEAKKPFREEIEKISQFASIATENLDLAIEIAKKKAAEYSSFMEEQKELEMAETAKAGEIMPIDKPKMSGESSSITTKTVKRFKIIDINKIPINYLEVNEKVINYTINNSDNVIPGIEIYEETTTSLRLKGRK